MAWVVIDTNEANLLPRPEKLRSDGEHQTGLSLHPYVLAELILHPRSESVLDRLKNHQIRLGLVSPDVLDAVATLPLAEVEGFEPFAVEGRTYRDDYAVILTAFEGVKPAHRAWATAIKKRHREQLRGVGRQATALRKHVRDQSARAGKKLQIRLETMEAAIESFGRRPDSFLHEIIAAALSGRDERIVTEMEERVVAILRNPYLGLWFRTWLAFLISISRWWRDQTKNFDPQEDRDDLTDLTLPMLVGPGDILVTRDRKLRMLVELADTRGVVLIGRANEVDSSESEAQS